MRNWLRYIFPVALTICAPGIPVAAACTIIVCNNGVCPSQEAFVDFKCPETAWRVWMRNTLKGLRVGPVDLQRTPSSGYMRILYSANVAEIFVPYHAGTPRLSDVQFCNLAPQCLRPVDAADAGPNGILVTMGGDAEPTVVAENRDRGIVWMCKWDSPSHVKKGSRSRRGEELVLWGAWDPGNYDYVVEYHFRDDGEITFRIGATGYNNPDFPEESHMHSVLWRVDADLDGAANDRPAIATHTEPYLSPLDAADLMLPFNFTGTEGFMDLDPLRFATLVIEDAQTKNVSGHEIGYELQPFRRGTARHFESNDQWTQHDTWLTRYDAEEDDAALSIPTYFGPDEYLLGTGSHSHPWGTKDAQPVNGHDIVLWHISSAHHDPHDEDQAAQDPTHGFKGLTLMHWSGFDLVPHNLFDYNPLGSPHRADCDGRL